MPFSQYPVGRQVGERAKAAQAFAQDLLRFLALQELADLPADHAHRSQQRLVRLAQLAAREGEDADHRIVEKHRREERCALARLRDALGPRGLRLLEVGDPAWLRRDDHVAQHAFRGDDLVGLVAVVVDRVPADARSAPARDQSRRADRILDAEEAGGLPLLAAADDGHDGLQDLAARRGLGEALGHFVLERHQRLGAPLLRQVARRPVEAEEDVVAKHRLSG